MSQILNSYPESGPVLDLFTDIFDGGPDQTTRAVSGFKRSETSIQIDGCPLHLTRDSLAEYELEHWWLSLPVADLPGDTITISPLRPTESLPGLVGVGPGDEWSVWIPRLPAVRRYDGRGRILMERDIHIEVSPDERSIRASTQSIRTGRLELPLVFVPTSTAHLDDLREPTAGETRTFVKGEWFRYDGIGSFWDYFIAGDIYDRRSKGKHGRWRCQQCAHTLSLLYLKLADETDKPVYRILSDLVAYSVAMSLPEDGRWRHGVWTASGETHTRYQTDGIQLLLTYHQLTGERLFLETATRAMEYLLDIADVLPGGGLWFLHDTLELTEESYSEHYRSLFESERVSESTSNTLALNTHIWSMVALRRLAVVSDDDRHAEAFEGALRALVRVLSLDPTPRVYRTADRMFDALAYDERTPDVVRSANSLASQLTILILKRLFPRLVMPSGRIERDLSHTARNDFYHLLNLKDLLVLNSYIDCDVVKDTIDDGIEFIRRNDLCMTLDDDWKFPTLRDIYLLADIQFDGDYTDLLEAATDHAASERAEVPVDSFAFGPVLDESVRRPYSDANL